MHIGFYAAALPNRPKPSGIVTYVSVMRDMLTALGHKVSVVTNDEVLTPEGKVLSLGRETHRGLAARIIDKARWLYNPENDPDMIVASAIAQAHAIDRFDIFEMEESFGWSADVADRLDIPVITRLHGPHYFHREPAHNAAETRRQTDRIAREGKAIAATPGLSAPSAKQLNATLEYYGAFPRLVRHIFNPVSIPDPADCWTEDGSVPKQVLMVGRFDTIKGADIAVQALLIAHQSDPALELVIVGPDFGVATPAGRLNFSEYIASVAGPEKRERISFLGPRLPHELAALRRRAAMVIIASRIENFPYAVAESLAIGAPTIATDVFGNAEMIEHGRNGLLVPVADAVALAEAMLRLAGDRREAVQFGREGRAFAIRALAPGPIAEATMKFYKEVIADKAQPRDRGS